MVKVKKNLTGKRFGKLTVLYQTEDYINPQGKHRSRWHCLCDCGNEIYVTGSHLTNGDSISCGCYRKQRIGIKSKKYNKHKTINEITIIYTNKGEEILVDTDSYNNIQKIKDICWCINENGYVVGRDCTINKVVFMHDVIMKPDFDKGEMVDHIYGQRFDNRVSKLRIATRTQNNQNKRIRSNNTNGIIGVHWVKDRKKWNAQITINGKTKNLGYHIEFDNAVKSRLKAEKEYFGEFAPQKHLFKQYEII